jgi:hypothetical protein
MKGLRNQKDLLAGVIFAAIGVAFFLAARTLPFGSTSRMGPGYFPVVLSLLLIASGVLVLLRGLLVPGGAPTRPSMRGLLCVVAGALLFALLVRPAGFAPALATCVVVTSLADPRTKLASALFLALAVVLASCLIFIVGLGLPWPVLGPWLGGR